jgi:hypothetical protein
MNPTHEGQVYASRAHRQKHTHTRTHINLQDTLRLRISASKSDSIQTDDEDPGVYTAGGRRNMNGGVRTFDEMTKA